MIIEFGGAGQHPRASRKQAGESDTRRRVVLRDGSKVLIRQVRSTDALLLADGFARLSAQSRLAGLSQRARQAGIRRFTALVAEDNVAVTGLLRNAGGTLVSRGPGTFEYEIVLTPEAEHSLDLWFRSAAASARCGTGLRSWTCWRRNCTPGLRALRRS